MKADKKYMQLAIKEARKNLKKPQGGPFGACIVKGDKTLAVARNTVLKKDASSHAEINAIRKASGKIKSFDLSGCVIYSTTEPCPMCFGAIHWANIGKVVYGTRISDAKKCGFNELAISSAAMKRLGKSKVKIQADFLVKDCKELLKEWNKSENKPLY